jgi:hypothetical protein
LMAEFTVWEAATGGQPSPIFQLALEPPRARARRGADYFFGGEPDNWDCFWK